MRSQDKKSAENKLSKGSMRRPDRTPSHSTTNSARDAVATLSHPTVASMNTLQRYAGNTATATAIKNGQRNNLGPMYTSGAQPAIQRMPVVQRKSPSSYTLKGRYIRQGNNRGDSTRTHDRVLYTSDLGPCVAVCGFNGEKAFMIHSDSTDTSGIGHLRLIDGIKSLVPSIGKGSGWSISLIGGSTAACKSYLRDKLPHASIYENGESDGAYITGEGVVARSKRRLAEEYGVDSIRITE